MQILEIIKKLYPFDYSIVGKGNDKAIKEFKKLLPFKVYSFKSGRSINEWKIPKEWCLVEGLIKTNNKIIFDAKKKKFGVPKNSKSFKGFVKFKDLKKRIFYSKIFNNATPYNWLGLYRFNKKNFWGFCMSKNDLKKMKHKSYLIDIKTEYKKNNMKVLEYTLKGKSRDTIIINAHNCHPYQANDDISGCAVGIKIFQELSKLKNRKFTYTLLIGPELYAPIFWLDKNKKKIKYFKYAILLKSVGNNNSLKLQHSVKGNSEIDRLAFKYLKMSKEKFKTGKFRTIYGNDEIVFDSTGYNISSISFTRFPFKEYHTDLDTPQNISKKSVEAVYKIVKSILLDFNKETRYKNKFKGVKALSHPKYNLYLTAAAPGLGKDKISQNTKNWNLLMNNLPNFIDQQRSLREIAEYHNLKYHDVDLYCKKWIQKKLIEKI